MVSLMSYSYSGTVSTNYFNIDCAHVGSEHIVWCQMQGQSIASIDTTEFIKALRLFVLWYVIVLTITSCARKEPIFS